MMTRTEIERIAKLLAGHEPGWQSRFASQLGVSRGYAHNLLTGERKISRQLSVKLRDAAAARIEVYRGLAAELENFLKPPKVVTVPEPVELPPPYTREQYERETDESMDVLDDIVFGATKQEDE